MSYDISLNDPVTHKTIQFDTPHMMTGGTYALGGTREAWLNVTYNYARWYYKEGVFPDRGHDDKEDLDLQGINSIYGMSGAESIPILKHAIEMLEAMDDDMDAQEVEKLRQERGGLYWVDTRENAIKPLYQLLALAQMRPDGVWCVD